MADTTYDIIFAGELVPGTEPAEARRRIQVLFKLSDEAADRMFGDRPVTIKRGVDSASVARYRDAFREAGAFIRAEPVPNFEELVATSEDSAPATPEAEIDRGDLSTGRSAGLQLAPLGDERPLESPQAVMPRKVDISYLSLVPGNDWTLADCEPPPPPLVAPDIGHLRIVEY
ncbi:MAG: hypothetical protein P8Y27_01300 [Chromatiaceae bacterium]|jgi:hypothetical protein